MPKRNAETIYNPITDKYVKNTVANRKRIDEITMRVYANIEANEAPIKNVSEIQRKKNERLQKKQTNTAKSTDDILGEAFIRKARMADADAINKRQARKQERLERNKNMNSKDDIVGENFIRSNNFVDDYTFVKKYQSKKFNNKAVIDRYKSNEKIPLTETTIERISKQIDELLILHLNKNKSTTLRVFLSNDDDTINKNIVFKSNEGGAEEIAKKLFKIQQLYTVKGDVYIFSIKNIEVLNVDLEPSGGCDKREHIAKHKQYKMKFGKKSNEVESYRFTTSMKTNSNNCSIVCFIRYLSGNALTKQKFIAKTIKKTLNFEPEQMVHYKDLYRISDYFGLSFICYNQEGVVLSEHTPKNNLYKEHTVLIELFNEHYMIRTNIEMMNKCPNCFHTYEKIHNCNFNNVSYVNNVCLKNQNVVSTVCKTFETKEDLSNVLVYDFETLNIKVGDCEKHKPYCVGFKFINGEYKTFWGEDTIVKFVDYLLSIEKETILSAYNGSKFDLYFIIEELNKRNYEIDKYLSNNGAIIGLQFGKCKVFDLCKFLLCPLSKACKDFKIKNAKTEFDHSLMSGFDVIDNHKKEVLEYLEMDVLALEELTKVMSETFFNKYQIHLHRYITASQLAYDLWTNTFSHSGEDKVDYNIFKITDLEDYEFVRSSIIGGRTYPLQKYFETALYDEIDKANESKDVLKLQELYKKVVETKDFIFNCDVVSLYPTAMMERYPVGNHRYSENPEQDFNNGLFGIYSISYIANKKIIVSPFVHKTEEGRALWCVEDGSGVYNNIDIQNAINLGYKITFGKKAIVWDRTEYVFKSYITDVYEWKKSKASDKNAEYQLAKLLMNSLYGKMLQKSCNQTTEFINNYEKLITFLKKNDVEEWIDIGEGMLMTGTAKDKEKKITKPSHLGSFILGYSRQIMFKYMKIITPSMDTHPFTYTDTDSLHVKGENYMKFVEKGCFGSDLGMLSNDCDGEKEDEKFKHNIGPVIIKETNLAPKLYSYYSLSASGKIKCVNKAKGIPVVDTLGDKSKLVVKELFLNEEKKVLNFTSFKKVHKTVHQPDKQQGITPFSVKTIVNTRTFLNSTWSGMIFRDNLYYPVGYVF